MGRRGPPPKPTAQLRLAGSPLADGREGEPEYAPGAFGPTMELGDAARAEWDRVYPQLVALGIATPLNAFPLTMLCRLAGEIDTLAKRIDIEGHTIEGTRGMKRNPADQALGEKMAQYQRWCQEFGVTPASKTRVQTGAGKGKGKLSELGIGG